MESGHDFGLGFVQIKRRTSQFGDRANQENQQSQRRQDGEPHPVLRLGNSSHTHRICQDGRYEQNNDHRNFVGDHVRHHAESSQQGIFVIRRPACHDNGECTQRTCCDDVKQSDIQIHAVNGGSQRQDRP